MRKKIIFRSFLIIFFFSFLIFLYLKSKNDEAFIKKKEEIELIERKNIELTEKKVESSNFMEDVSYSAKDMRGNEYLLKAGEGTIDQKDNNYIFLKSVNAVINLKN